MAEWTLLNGFADRRIEEPKFIFCGANMAMNGAASTAQGAADALGSGLPNIFVALERQIGFSLMKTKDIPLDAIVVDHVEKIPTGN
jgi:uncharacterized protein (TIGR03435 family)